MPRFEDEHISCLKRVMLPRLPGCFFAPEDFPIITGETGLNKEQIEQWAWNLRFRLPMDVDREAFIRANETPEQATSTKLNRCYVTCFNVYPGLVQEFKMPKSRGDGEFNVTFMEGAYSKEGEFGEFYVEFKETVWEHKVAEQFRSMGAGQVNTITFQHNDGQESASNALLRVWQLGEKTGYHEKRGEYPAALYAKTQAKLEESRKRNDKSEFDEKTQAALKASLEGIGEKVEDMHGDVKDVKNELYNVVSELRNENVNLKAEIKRINLLRDQLEYKVGRQTSIENKLDIVNVDLHEANKKNKALEKELEVYKSLELSQKANETAKWIIESGQSLKRPRVD